VIYGKILGELAGDYHASGADGSTAINTFIRNERLYQGQYVSGEFPRPDGNAFEFGRLFHMAVLEPDRFSREVRRLDGDGRTREFKDKRAEYESAGIQAISGSDHGQIMRMVDAVFGNSEARDLIAGEREVTFRALDAATGIDLQCRADVFRSDGHMVDLKSTDSIGKFPRSFRSYGYNIQEAHYRAVAGSFADVCGFSFLVVEKNAPFEVRIYEQDGDSLLHAQQVWRDAIDRLAERRRTGQWQRDKPGVHLLTLPKWVGEDPHVDDDGGISL
jgi:hypothetical protein